MENIYLNTLQKSQCNGCGICTLKCPKDAIHMMEDKEGFLYPVIEESKCIECGKCKRICSNIKEENQYLQKTYIAINKKQKDKENSSSGGMYYAIARYVIENKGVVFGVEFSDELEAKHSYAETLKDCKKFQGSKYVRSNIGNIYEQVEKFLKQDRMVLFTGTPCQCNALKVFLSKDYKKLITCDILCHANPSPKVLKMYLKNLEKIKNKKVKDILFRPKETGWRNQIPLIVYDDGQREEESSYINGFLYELISRPSCYDCKFVSPERITDFPIGDFWGIEKIDKKYENEEGVSLFKINSKKANEIFELIEQKIFYEEVDTVKAFSYNRHCNVKKHPNRKKFFKHMKEDKIIFQLKKYVKKPLYRRVLGKIKRTLIKK